MRENIILTCAVTGEGPFNRAHPAFPITPRQIASAALESIEAGASVVHLHVRDPVTGEGSRDLQLFQETVGIIRDSGKDVVINLSAGMGGDFCPVAENEGHAGPSSDIAPAAERLRHVADLRPEICSLDVTTMNTEAANARMQGAPASVYLNTTRTLREMARLILQYGVKPEIELFSPGDAMFAAQLIEEGLIATPALFQIVLGVKWGAPATPETMIYMRSVLPKDSHWAAFGIGRMQMPMLAQAAILGGNGRVGLEDNLYLRKGVFASNAQLVEQAKSMLSILGKSIATPAETRAILGLSRQAH